MKKKIQKPFDAEAAKRGAKIETREGRSVRIVCYDRAGTDYPIVCLVNYDGGEKCFTYTIEGNVLINEEDKDNLVIIEEVECPKFNVGDWVFAKNDGERPWLITAVYNNWYEVQDTEGHKDNIARITIDNYFRLWSLKDVKPGDVLISEGDKHPFIFKKFLAYAPSAYCGIDTTDSIYISDEDLPWTRDTVRPATYKEKRQFFDRLKEEGYKWDDESLTLSKIQKRWRDNIDVDMSGYFIDRDSRIKFYSGYNIPSDHNIFATEKQAKSALAMARISQIMATDKRFGGIVTDEELDVRSWYCIVRVHRILLVDARSSYEFLTFHTEEQAKLFLEENEDLVKDYYMMD